jgi:hypothetical protein
MSYLHIVVSKILADVFFEHRPKKFYGWRSYWHHPNVLHMCFGQFNRTKNRGHVLMA